MKSENYFFKDKNFLEIKIYCCFISDFYMEVWNSKENKVMK